MKAALLSFLLQEQGALFVCHGERKLDHLFPQHRLIKNMIISCIKSEDKKEG